MPTVLYLHGFASSPDSHKGKAYDAYLSERGFDVQRLDLRLPARDGLRVSAMIEHVLGRARDVEGVILIGSSLGGLVAAHAAERLSAVSAVVLMCPAFRFALRWKLSLGEAQLARWQAGEPLEVEDHAGGPPLRIDYGFYQDAIAIDDHIPSLGCPALVFHGTRDEVVPIDGSRAFVAQAADARLVEVDDDHGLAASLDFMLPAVEHFLTA
jgi:pimeloyl-ACP methyl ester carboxylesterase